MKSEVKAGASTPRWFRPLPMAAVGDSARGAAVKLAIGVSFGALFFALGLRTLAVVVWSIAGTLGGLSLASSAARRFIAFAFARLGELLGRLFAFLLLTPFLLVLAVARGGLRLLGRDPLRLRDHEARSFWLDCDTADRKDNAASRMYATERQAGGRRVLPVLLGAVLVLLLAGEVTLRSLGYGTPLLYRLDPTAGYFPAETQDIRRLGARIRTNAFGMRAPDYTREKPPGVFRVLVLGGDPLWGGARVSQEHHLTEHLETRIKAAAGAERTVQVLVAAAPGWGAAEILGYTERFGTFGADVVVLALSAGELARAGPTAPPFASHRPPWLALETLFAEALFRLQQRRLYPLSEDLAGELRERGVASLAALTARFVAAGARLLIVPLPDCEGGQGPEVVRAWLAGGGAALTKHITRPSEDITECAGGDHFGPEDHETLATRLADHIAAGGAP